jgi:hypothetical protein
MNIFDDVLILTFADFCANLFPGTWGSRAGHNNDYTFGPNFWPIIVGTIGFFQLAPCAEFPHHHFDH